MSIIVVPVLLVILHEYFYITVIAVVYSAFLYLFFTSMYELIRNELLEELLDDENATSTAKSTAQLIKDLKNAKSLELFKAQEELKNFKIIQTKFKHLEV